MNKQKYLIWAFVYFLVAVVLGIIMISIGDFKKPSIFPEDVWRIILAIILLIMIASPLCYMLSSPSDKEHATCNNCHKKIREDKLLETDVGIKEFHCPKCGGVI